MTTHDSAHLLTQVNFLDEPVQSPVEDHHEGLLGLPHLFSVLQILKVYHIRNCSPILNGVPPATEYGLLYTGLYIFSIPAGLCIRTMDTCGRYGRLMVAWIGPIA